MSNDAEDYIAAVAAACTAAGLNVTEWGSDDIDPRDGSVTLRLPRGPHGDEPEVPDEEYEEWRYSVTLGWDEEKGWMWGEPRNRYGELTNLVWLGRGLRGGDVLPAPAEVAEMARRLAGDEVSMDEYRRMMDPTQYREQDDEDGFDARLAAYVSGGLWPKATP